MDAILDQTTIIVTINLVELEGQVIIVTFAETQVETYFVIVGLVLRRSVLLGTPLKRSPNNNYISNS